MMMMMMMIVMISVNFQVRTSRFCMEVDPDNTFDTIEKLKNVQ